LTAYYIPIVLSGVHPCNLRTIYDHALFSRKEVYLHEHKAFLCQNHSGLGGLLLLATSPKFSGDPYEQSGALGSSDQFWKGCVAVQV